jgi:DNA polymerase I-like protein with 3'-5' exonuclease and polymerase domains
MDPQPQKPKRQFQRRPKPTTTTSGAAATTTPAQTTEQGQKPRGMRKVLKDKNVDKLPVFSVPADKTVFLIESLHQCSEALKKELGRIKVMGFDCEWKVSFAKDQKTSGPDLVQLSTRDSIYLFRIFKDPQLLTVLKPILESESQTKVGFNLHADQSLLLNDHNIQLNGYIDCSHAAVGDDSSRPSNIRITMAHVLKQHIDKPKKLTLSNWQAPTLTPEQQQYAACDAYAALIVFEEMYQTKQIPSTIISEATQKVLTVQYPSVSKPQGANKPQSQPQAQQQKPPTQQPVQQPVQQKPPTQQPIQQPVQTFG